MADVIDQVEGGEAAAVAPTPAVAEPECGQEFGQVEVPAGETPRDNDADLGPMVSPLQQEHELLKKSQGVDNNVAEFAGEDTGFESELAAMKQSAGIEGENNCEPEVKCRFVKLKRH